MLSVTDQQTYQKIYYLQHRSAKVLTNKEKLEKLAKRKALQEAAGKHTKRTYRKKSTWCIFKDEYIKKTRQSKRFVKGKLDPRDIIIRDGYFILEFD
eukprot:scaffold612_cov122-Ochromonas_danica.AAC.2